MKDATIATSASQPGIAQQLLRFRELGIIGFTVVLVGIAALIEPRFIEAENLRNILRYIPLIIVVAMGQMMVIVSRNIDLSIGSTLGFSAIVVGNLFVTFPHCPIWLATLVALLTGASLGAINGLLVAWLRIPAIIATLGTLSIYRGLTFLISGGRQVDPNHIPTELIRLSQTSPLGIPWLVIFAGAIAVGTYLFLRYVQTGREIYALGSNPEAAALRGMSVSGNTLLVFTVCGALAGLAGIMFASRFGYVNPSDTGVGFELIVISAVIIGGTNVFGGSGTVLGTLTGCLLLGVVYVGLAVLGISAFWQLAIYGVAILVAVSFDTIVQRKIGKSKEGGVLL
jgi:rhamnose transport system permease protein